ncbi:unnamed protein product [Clonostachys byssicola]|uniref:Peptidase M43 pregnancy-associated plasma-A domain-containing protein n=1 Tax=Clonostachys byssicola TaxID=160290 RepID=A0A9N9UY60_9HYPO|nr:unnamed protein product [Clonostachys byssicola]
MAFNLLGLATLAAGALASCGTTLMPEHKDMYKRAASLTRPEDLSLASRQTVEIDTYIHVVSNGTTAEEGYVTVDQLDQQMAVLNEVFGRHSYHYNVKNVEYIESEAWAHGEDRQNMLMTLHKGEYHDLNLYFLKNMGPTNFGQCSYPLNLTNFEGTEGLKERMIMLDGCMVVSNTVPGGSRPGKHDGLATVHEVGHWLLHVWSSACGDDGDLVDDTPAQSTHHYGCPVGADSCPDLPGVDSINNYMDLTDDDCQTGFTPGQVSRMHTMWTTFREPTM